ncbi:hypothetical protein L6452_38691 [Arctium lappa]|uniref:Uncharacterized protein n=1 Tax=Arctium lappa TaxID=4217 RepID=A0ACB8XQS9_ARCLA|nr:hypothetical protein L6452_38691 [Arctium lappa]
MCAKVGVDPLASNKGFWAELLGIGDFYYELGHNFFLHECVLLILLNISLLLLLSEKRRTISVEGLDVLKDFTQIGSSALGHHIVPLTSTTYGLLILDPSSSKTTVSATALSSRVTLLSISPTEI